VSIIRRLRGILGTACFWGGVWALGAVPILLALAVLFGSPWPLLRLARSALWVGFVGGAGAGALFASALMLAEQNRPLNALSQARLALWGALAGSWWYVLVAIQSPWAWNPLKIAPFWIAMTLTAIAGSFSGLATVWLARRAQEPGLVDAPDLRALDSPTPLAPPEVRNQSSLRSTSRL
jgi:hypothetical protein